MFHVKHRSVHSELEVIFAALKGFYTCFQRMMLLL